MLTHSLCMAEKIDALILPDGAKKRSDTAPETRNGSFSRLSPGFCSHFTGRFSSSFNWASSAIIV